MATEKDQVFEEIGRQLKLLSDAVLANEKRITELESNIMMGMFSGLRGVAKMLDTPLKDDKNTEVEDDR